MSDIVTVVETGPAMLLEIAVAGPQGPRGEPGEHGKSLAELPTRMPLSGHKAIAVDADGYAVYASHADAASVLSYVGMSLGAATNGTPLTVQAHGELIEPTWGWVPGQPIYIGLDGALTQSAPSGAQRIIAVALSATRIFLAPMPGVITV